jgi:transmembrane sensor
MREQGKVGTSLSDQAIEWLVALDNGSADADAFERWRNADPRHASVFAQVAATWKRTADQRLSAMLNTSVSQDEEISTPSSRAMVSRRAVAGGLAGLLGLAGAGAFIAWPRRAYAETTVGERRILSLQDGSQAMLNTDTRVAWRFHGDGRDFWVERGEATLLVKEGGQPFRLYSDPIDGRLSAGKFSLRIDPSEARLLVLAGRAAAIYRNTQSRTLDAGSLLSVSHGDAHVDQLSAEALSDAIAWERGEILFRGMTLNQAIAEYNRYLKVKLVVQDPALGATRLGGTFHTTDPEAFLVALEDGFGIAHRQQGETILLFPSRGT